MSWYHSAFVVAVIVMGTGVCFAGLSFENCKKLEVVIAGPLSGTESCLIVEAGPSFVSDFRGIVQKVA